MTTSDQGLQSEPSCGRAGPPQPMSPPIPGTSDPTTVPPRRLWMNRGPHLSPEGYRPVACSIRASRPASPSSARSGERASRSSRSVIAAGTEAGSRSTPAACAAARHRLIPTSSSGGSARSPSGGSIDLVAPSDNVSFAVGEALARLGRKSADAGHAPFEAVRRRCSRGALLRRWRRSGFPTPPSATPVSLAEARCAAASSAIR